MRRPTGSAPPDKGQPLVEELDEAVLGGGLVRRAVHGPQITGHALPVLTAGESERVLRLPALMAGSRLGGLTVRPRRRVGAETRLEETPWSPLLVSMGVTV